MAKYIRLNEEPIEIEYVEDEHDEELDFQPSFWFENHRHYIKDFLRCHNNPWCLGSYPDYIHGQQADGSPFMWEDPLYIELIGDEAVNVYRYKEER